MKKKKQTCVCHECAVTMEIVVTGTLSGDKRSKLIPEICPFCGDVVELEDDRPFLKDFDDYDDFDDDKYYTDDDEIEDD